MIQMSQKIVDLNTDKQLERGVSLFSGKKKIHGGQIK